MFGLVDGAFNLAARGANDISFNRSIPRGASLVRVLVTGFDPFKPGAPVPPGIFNPSGAAALALDNTRVSPGGGVVAAVESVVLPVDFGEFRSGLVEGIVRPLVRSRGVDAVLTVSLDESIKRDQPVRLERFVVGVHEERGALGPVTAAPGGTLGQAIVETPVDLEDVARRTARRAGSAGPAIQQPTIGTDVTFRFPSAAAADRARAALGMPAQQDPELTITDVATLRSIGAGAVRAPNGIDLTFPIGRETFQAAVVSGPGGNFLSNEVSFRVLRLLGEEGRQDIESFHTHVPRPLDRRGEGIPQNPVTAPARRKRVRAIRRATEAVDRLVVTLRRMIGVVAERIAARRRSSSGTGGTP